MELHIISPTSSYSYDVAWVEAHTSQGSFTIQQGHVPVILPLSSGKPITFMLQTGKLQSIMIDSGLLEVNRTMVTVIMHEVH